MGRIWAKFAIAALMALAIISKSTYAIENSQMLEQDHPQFRQPNAAELRGPHREPVQSDLSEVRGPHCGGEGGGADCEVAELEQFGVGLHDEDAGNVGMDFAENNLSDLDYLEHEISATQMERVDDEMFQEHATGVGEIYEEQKEKEGMENSFLEYPYSDVGLNDADEEISEVTNYNETDAADPIDSEIYEEVISSNSEFEDQVEDSDPMLHGKDLLAKFEEADGQISDAQESIHEFKHEAEDENSNGNVDASYIDKESSEQFLKSRDANSEDDSNLRDKDENEENNSVLNVENIGNEIDSETHSLDNPVEHSDGLLDVLQDQEHSVETQETRQETSDSISDRYTKDNDNTEEDNYIQINERIQELTDRILQTDEEINDNLAQLRNSKFSSLKFSQKLIDLQQEINEIVIIQQKTILQLKALQNSKKQYVQKKFEEGFNNWSPFQRLNTEFLKQIHRINSILGSSEEVFRKLRNQYIDPMIRDGIKRLEEPHRNLNELIKSADSFIEPLRSALKKTRLGEVINVDENFTIPRISLTIFAGLISLLVVIYK